MRANALLALAAVPACATEPAPAPPAAPVAAPPREGLRPAWSGGAWGYQDADGDWISDKRYAPLDVLSTDTPLGRRDRQWWWVRPTVVASNPRLLPCDGVTPLARPDRVICTLAGSARLMGPEGPVGSGTYPAIHPLRDGWTVGWTPSQVTLLDPDGQPHGQAGYFHMAGPELFVVSDRAPDSPRAGAAMIADKAFERFDPETGARSPLERYPVVQNDDATVVAGEKSRSSVVPAGASEPAWDHPRSVRLVGEGRAAAQSEDGSWSLVDVATGAPVGDRPGWRIPDSSWLAVPREPAFAAGRLPILDPDTERCGYLAPDGTLAFGMAEGQARCSPFVGGRAVTVIGDVAYVVGPDGQPADWQPVPPHSTEAAP